MKSRILYPLRSNAKSLVLGPSINALRRRIKLSALLFDEILIQEGAFIIEAGEGASVAIWRPAENTKLASWQTPRERGKIVREGVEFEISPIEDQPNLSRQIITSNAPIAWRATFEPLKKEFTKAFDWIQFGNLPDPPEHNEQIKKWVLEDYENSDLIRFVPKNIARRMISSHANRDLVLGACLGASVAMDSLHHKVAEARVLQGNAQPILGEKVLETILPDVTSLDWEQIDEIRMNVDLQDFRDILREIEYEVWRSAQPLSGLELFIKDRYSDRLAKVAEGVRSTWQDRIITTGVSMFVGELIGFSFGVPLVGSLAGATTGFVRDHISSKQKTPKWIAADLAIRKRIKKRRA